MPKQLKLGVDLDGVAANFNKSFSQLCKSQGIDLPDFSTVDPPIWDYPEHFGATPEQMQEVWRLIKESENFWAQLEPYAGATAALKELSELSEKGHEVYFLTLRRGLTSKVQSERWLRECGVKNPTVLITPNGKARLAHELGLTHVIDDYPVMVREYCLHASALKPYPKVYLLNRAYNKSCKSLPCVSVDSLAEFVKSVKKDI